MSTRTATLGVALSRSDRDIGAPDQHLWARLREADEQALTTLFHRHSDAVYNFAFRRLSSWSAAEDAVQATFTSLWRRARSGRIDALTLDSARIREILDEIPARQREVVELVIWSECSMAEAARALGVPEGTVKSRLARARRALATRLDLGSTALEVSE